MNNLTLSIKKLVLLSALLLSSVANAGLITTELTSASVIESSTGNSFFNNPYGDDNFDFIITGKHRITDGDWAQFSWNIDTKNLLSLSFDLSAINPNFATAKVSLGSIDLALESQTLDFSLLPYKNFVDNKVLLTFKLIAQGDFSSRDLGRNKPSLQFGNIILNRATSVPEPSTIVLFLLAIVFISRKQLAK